MPRLEIPVIGIGAGLATDGQVLVFHDLLGITTGPHNPRFVKRYAEIHDRMVEGVQAYVNEVRVRRFPDAEHVYSADPSEVDELKRYLTRRRAWPPPPGTGSGSAGGRLALVTLPEWRSTHPSTGCRHAATARWLT